MHHSPLPPDASINVIFGVLATIIGIATIIVTLRCRRSWRRRNASNPSCVCDMPRVSHV